MMRDLKFKMFKDSMEEKTKKILKANENFEDENAVTLDFYENIHYHLEDIGFEITNNVDDQESETSAFNLAYNEIERLYLDYLKSLKQ